MRTRIVACIFLLLGAVSTCGLMWYITKDAEVRIVRSGGALMALEGDGLRQLNELYSLSKDCSVAAAADSQTMNFCSPTLAPITAEMIRKGVVFIPEGTRAVSLGRRFIVPGGRLADPYPANTYDMARDGAVEVERVRITRPSYENREGWISVYFLTRVCCALP